MYSYLYLIKFESLKLDKLAMSSTKIYFIFIIAMTLIVVHAEQAFAPTNILPFSSSTDTNNVKPNESKFFLYQNSTYGVKI
jgi:hypothetical protein